ncbi:MAG: cysteine desulfurase family protein [Parvibaculum sp.]
MTTRAYMDHNATAPVHPEAAAAVARALTLTGNPSSVHHEGRAAHALIEEARTSVATLVNAKPEEVIFTSGGTEAANLAIHIAKTSLGVDRLVVSAIEHDCIRASAAASGLPVDIVPVLPNGVIDIEALEALVALPGTPLVAVMVANNETGVIQPVDKVAEIARAQGAIFLTDAIQAVGRLKIDFKALGADMLLISGHKFGAPQGIGALVLHEGLAVEPMMRGGGQEKRRRAGTENVPAIVGFGVAARMAMAQEDLSKIEALRDDLERKLREVTPDIVIFGHDAERLPNTSLFAARGLDASTLLMVLDLDGFAVSSGSACSSGKVARSHVLEAMGVDETLAKAAIRVSLGAENTRDEIDRLVTSWARVWKRAQGKVQSKTASANTPAFAEVER